MEEDGIHCFASSDFGNNCCCNLEFNARLIDALTGRHIWAEKYERDLKDLFALQDEITMQILTATRVKLSERELSSAYSKYYKGKKGFDCYLKLMEAAKYAERFTIEDNNVARRLNEEAISMCPENPVGYAQLGGVYTQDMVLGNMKSSRETLERGEEMVKKALSMDDSLPIAHIRLCVVHIYKREHDKAIAEGERAVALDPSGSFAILNMPRPCSLHADRRKPFHCSKKQSDSTPTLRPKPL
jgi:adenylate cyclase